MHGYISLLITSCTLMYAKAHTPQLIWYYIPNLLLLLIFPYLLPPFRLTGPYDWLRWMNGVYYFICNHSGSTIFVQEAFTRLISLCLSSSLFFFLLAFWWLYYRMQQHSAKWEEPYCCVEIAPSFIIRSVGLFMIPFLLAPLVLPYSSLRNGFNFVQQP